jgi:squalene-hopene/tetraprenyl-beta-curcumene cyclase
MGGAAKVNVFTRITLALFGQLPWHTRRPLPVEIMLLPKWFFFHLDKVSYWSRTVIVPLLLL